MVEVCEDILQEPYLFPAGQYTLVHYHNALLLNFCHKKQVSVDSEKIL